MYIELVFYVMLLGHVLADFYFQSDEIAKAKGTSFKAFFIHAILYAVCFAAVFCICCFHDVSSLRKNLPLVLMACILHAGIDSFKLILTKISDIENKSKPAVFFRDSILLRLKKAVNYLRFAGEKSTDTVTHNMSGWTLLLDQTLHIVALLITYYIFGTGIQVNRFVSQEYEHLPYPPIIIILGVLCLLKPVSFFITRTALWDQKNTSADGEPAESDKPPVKNELPSNGQPQEGAGGGSQITSDSGNSMNDVTPESIRTGEIIGYLERLIIFFLIIYNQIEAIGFVLAAKSLIRHKEMKKRKKAEYYLIGTLLSVISALAITMLLGMCRPDGGL